LISRGKQPTDDLSKWKDLVNVIMLKNLPLQHWVAYTQFNYSMFIAILPLGMSKDTQCTRQHRPHLSFLNSMVVEKVLYYSPDCQEDFDICLAVAAKCMGTLCSNDAKPCFIEILKHGTSAEDVVHHLQIAPE